MEELVIAFLSDFITFPSGSYSLKILAWKITLWLIDWLIDRFFVSTMERFIDRTIDRDQSIGWFVFNWLIDWFVSMAHWHFVFLVFVCFSWSMKLCQREAQERKLLLAKHSWYKNCLRTSNASGSNLFNCEGIKCLARDIWKHCTL